MTNHEPRDDSDFTSGKLDEAGKKYRSSFGSARSSNLGTHSAFGRQIREDESVSQPLARSASPQQSIVDSKTVFSRDKSKKTSVEFSLRHVINKIPYSTTTALMAVLNVFYIFKLGIRWISKRWFTILGLSFIVLIILYACDILRVMYLIPEFGFGERLGSSTGIIPAKTLWDWLELLIAPIILVAVGAIITSTIQRTERERTQKQEKIEKEKSAAQARIEKQKSDAQAQIERQKAEFQAQLQREREQRQADDDRRKAEDTLQEIALHTYFDRMGELIMKEGLGKTETRDEIRVLARARTVTTLRILDPRRKGMVLSFLYEANLLQVGSSAAVKLASADLVGIEMPQANLSRANLNFALLKYADFIESDLSYTTFVGASLEGARLNRANLKGANLSEANLSEATFYDANLDEANLQGAIVDYDQFVFCSLRGATMPDGTIHH